MDFRPAELETFPGYYIRRLQQVAVAMFMEEVQEFGVTPVQFAALSAVTRMPGLDQRSLARFIAFDASTIGAVIDRLESRGLLTRSNSAKDRRVRLLHVTEEGRQLLMQAQPAVLRAQERMLGPLPEASRGPFMEMLALLIDEYDKAGRGNPSLGAKAANDEG